jgi:hypothetical protein
MATARKAKTKPKSSSRQIQITVQQHWAIGVMQHTGACDTVLERCRMYATPEQAWGGLPNDDLQWACDNFNVAYKDGEAIRKEHPKLPSKIRTVIDKWLRKKPEVERVVIEGNTLWASDKDFTVAV